MLRRRVVPLLFVLACLGVPALAAQHSPSTPAAQSAQAGPRIQPEFKTYAPAIGREEPATAAAAADRVTITLTTLGLVLLIVLLIVLIA